jgi:diguanylate cyclase (GGDEF)-like protein
MRETVLRFRMSLQAKILLVVLLCVVVPLLLTGFYLLSLNQEVLGDRVRESLSNHLFRKTTELDDWLGQRLREAARWSASFVVYEGIESLSKPGADHERVRRDLRDYLVELLGHYQVYESLFIVDLKGTVLAATREEHLEGRELALLVRGDVPKRSGIVGPLHRSESLDKPTLLVLQPIQGQGESTLGYFVERLDLREVEAALASPAADLAPSFWLLDDEANVLMRAGKLVSSPGTEAFPIAAKVDAGFSQADIAGLGPTLYGLRRLQGPLAGYVVAMVPAGAAYRPLVESRSRLLRFGIPAILLICAACVFAARRMLDPILLLSEGAKRVSAGDLDVFLPVRGRDELSDLTGAFNEMARKVRESRQNLEEAKDALTQTNEGLKAANRTLEALAITDGLTGLYNRRHFQESLDREMRRCEREGRPLSLVLGDLDHFKEYNDRWGHTEGDAALRRVAGQVMKSIRSTDMAFRYGGEELAVLLPACTKEQASEVAEKIRASVSAGSLRPGRFSGRTTVSIGVATFPEDGRVARGLVDTADAALYAAKAQGRDRVVVAGTSFPRKVETGRF